MKTDTPPVGLPARSIARGPMMSLACAAAVALAILAMAFSSTAGAASAPAVEAAIIQVELDGGHDNPDVLAADDGMFMLTSIVAERQERANGDALDMDALTIELQSTFESVDPEDPELVYTVVLIDGRYYTICKFRETIVVLDPPLGDPVSVTQTTTMVLD